MATKTRTVAGVKVSLDEGIRYLATRPMASRRGEIFTVTISDYYSRESAAKITGLGYDRANEFLAAFNNGDMSFDGRIW